MNKKIKLYIVVTMGLMLAVGCASSKSTQNSLDGSTEMGTTGLAVGVPISKGEIVNSDFGGDNVIPEEAKLISRYSFSLETLDFQNSSSGMSELVQKYNGYVSSSNVQNEKSIDGRIQRTASYTFNLPKDEVLAFNEELMKAGNLLTENSSSEDVSKQYSDIESRIAAMESQEKRLNELYNKAEKIEDIIIIESRLSNLIAEKEIMKAQLQSYDNKVAYTTVGLQLIEVGKLSTEETVQATPTERFKNALKESIYDFKELVVGIAIGMIFTLPYVLIIGIVGIGLYLLLSWVDRRNKKRVDKDTDAPSEGNNEPKDNSKPKYIDEPKYNGKPRYIDLSIYDGKPKYNSKPKYINKPVDNGELKRFDKPIDNDEPIDNGKLEYNDEPIDDSKHECFDKFEDNREPEDYRVEDCIDSDEK